MPDPFKPGLDKLKRFSEQQQKNMGKPSKEVWAETHLLELVTFWRTWNRGQLGAMEDIIAVAARREGLAFNPAKGVTVAFVRIALGFNRQTASRWAKVVDAIISGKMTEKQFKAKGLYVAAEGRRKAKRVKGTASTDNTKSRAKVGSKPGAGPGGKQLQRPEFDENPWGEDVDPFD